MYNLVFSGFTTKEQAEEFLSWYTGAGEDNFGDWLEYRPCEESFMSVDYNKIPEWFGDNCIAHLNICKGEKE